MCTEYPCSPCYTISNTKPDMWLPPPERLQRGVPCWLLNLRCMGTQRVQIIGSIWSKISTHSLFGLPVHHSCTHWLRPATRIWAHIRGRYWSAKIDDIPLRTTGSKARGPSLVGFTQYIYSERGGIGLAISDKKLFRGRRNRRKKNNWFFPAEFRLFRGTENSRNSVLNYIFRRAEK